MSTTTAAALAAAIVEADRRHVWHPYGTVGTSGAPPPLPVVGADGVRLALADGRELIDGMSSWWCAIHGYRHPVLDAAIRDQLERVAHVMFGGLTHEPAVLLAQRLVEMTPAGLEHVFFADSGSVSVEVAIKMCLQAATARGDGRRRLLTIRGGYHGDTFGAMAVCDPVSGMHRLFAGTLAEHVFADRPPANGGPIVTGNTVVTGGTGGADAGLDPAYAAHLDAVFTAHGPELAAVIVEPVVQGAGGMHFYSPAVVRALRDRCDEHGVALILDEIATGFGRTGALFACELAGVTPDVLCVGKALTGGYLSLAATLCTPEIAAAIASGPGGALMHGPTFMGNPLACSVALASTGLLLDGSWREDVARIERGLTDGLAPARALPGVLDVRVLGAIGVVQLRDEVDIEAASRAAIDCGVWLRPFRDLVYTMPPYLTGDGDVAQIAAALVAAAAAG